MNARRFAILYAVPFLLLSSAPIQSQTNGIQDGVKVGKVYVTGENPGIRLLDKEGGQALTAVSYWRIAWSPAGAGHICFVTTGDGKSSGDLRIALVDNQKLYDFLTQQIMGVIDTSLSTRPYTVMQAKFSDPGQGAFDESGVMKERTVTAKSNKYAVELVWRDFYEPFQLDTPVGGQRNPFGIASLFIPAKSADVIINGKKSAGNVDPQQRGPVQSSTAFLAFSESWLK